MTETNTDTVATGRLTATKAQGQSIFELSLANRRATAQRVDGTCLLYTSPSPRD